MINKAEALAELLAPFLAKNEPELSRDGMRAVFELAQCVPAILRERKDLIALLREIQWACVDSCPYCGGGRPGASEHLPLDMRAEPGKYVGHALNCRLAAPLGT